MFIYSIQVVLKDCFIRFTILAFALSDFLFLCLNPIFASSLLLANFKLLRLLLLYRLLIFTSLAIPSSMFEWLSYNLRILDGLWLIEFYARLTYHLFFWVFGIFFINPVLLFPLFQLSRLSYLWNCPSFIFFVSKLSFEFLFKSLSF